MVVSVIRSCFALFVFIAERATLNRGVFVFPLAQLDDSDLAIAAKPGS